MKVNWKGPKTGEYIGVNMRLIQFKIPDKYTMPQNYAHFAVGRLTGILH